MPADEQDSDNVEEPNIEKKNKEKENREKTFKNIMDKYYDNERPIHPDSDTDTDCNE